MKKFDPITAEVIRCSLETIADEIGYTMTTSAKNINFSESHDFSTAIFDGQGQIACLSDKNGLPIHQGAATFSVKSALGYFGLDNIYPGDIIVLNDPYFGGSHLPDWTVIQPVFHDGEIVFFTCVRAHMEDTGGMVPGSYCPQSTDIWQEGLRLSPIKIYVKGEPRRDILKMLEINTRSWSFPGDLQAMIGGSKIGGKRLIELINKYGKETIKEYFEYLYDHSERMLRAVISDIPDGSYYGEGKVEHDGVGSAEDITVRAKVIIKGSDIIIDFSDSDRQVTGCINTTLPNTYTWIYVTLAGFTEAEIPKNEGIYRPLTVIAPKGCVVNGQEPAGVTVSNIHMGGEASEAITFALEKAIPEKAYSYKITIAPPIIFYGMDPKRNRFFTDHNLDAWGGACSAAYGTDGWGLFPSIFGALNLYNVEICDYLYPKLTVAYEYETDTGGPGKWRGACAASTIKKVLCPMTVNFMVLGNKYPMRGYNGGKEGVCNKYIVNYGDKDQKEIEKFYPMQPIEPDRMIYQRFAGGGGWGDPFERDPRLVLEDVLDDYVSIEGAKRDYGVVIKGDTLEIDYKATESLRKERQAKK